MISVIRKWHIAVSEDQHTATAIKSFEPGAPVFTVKLTTRAYPSLLKLEVSSSVPNSPKQLPGYVLREIIRLMYLPRRTDQRE